MAMGKNKTGIMAAITAASEASKESASDRAHRTLPKGTIGSVRAGLGGIQEIDTNLILAWGPKDRLDIELTAVNTDATNESIHDLAASIAESGQQVPVLLRPSKDRDGHFEVIYGQRRILACSHLGMPVRALIRTLDDTDALMAKGLENAGRAELSYYERVRFAQAILEQGYSRAEACQALAISKNTLSQLERINRLVPVAVGEAIGALFLRSARHQAPGAQSGPRSQRRSRRSNFLKSAYWVYLVNQVPLIPTGGWTSSSRKLASEESKSGLSKSARPFLVCRSRVGNRDSQ